MDAHSIGALAENALCLEMIVCVVHLYLKRKKEEEEAE